MSLVDGLLVILLLGGSIAVVVRSFRKGSCHCDQCSDQSCEERKNE